MSRLYEEFTRLRDEKNSLIILGLDPKNFEQAFKCIKLTELNEGFIGGKPNLKFYQENWGRNILIQLSNNLKRKGLIDLLDLKSSDGADSNLAEIKSLSEFFNYMTIAPASSDIEDTIEYAKNEGVETISMGVMSFPGILRKLHDGGYKVMLKEIERSVESGTAGIVMGATGYVPQSGIKETLEDYRKKNSGSLRSLTDSELISAIHIRNNLFRDVVELIKGKNIISLVPGFGRQGGNLEYFLESGIDINLCAMNEGSDMLKTLDVIDAIGKRNEIYNQYRN